MEDSHFYKIRGVEGELAYYAKLFKNDSFSKEVPSESKRKAIRQMLINIARHVQTIQSNIGQEFVPEF